jgi:hypothetical protein
MSGWAAEIERLGKALDRLEDAIANRDGRYAAHAKSVADAARREAAEAARRETIAEMEEELRQETASVAERIDVVIERIESILKA